MAYFYELIHIIVMQTDTVAIEMVWSHQWIFPLKWTFADATYNSLNFSSAFFGVTIYCAIWSALIALKHAHIVQRSLTAETETKRANLIKTKPAHCEHAC